MTVLSAQSIRERVLEVPKWGIGSKFPLGIEPFSESKQACGMSYGLTGAGYDIRLGKIQDPSASLCRTPKDLQSILIRPGEFVLAASLERLEIPNDLQAIVHDKSTLARQGLALQNTVLEPGWHGWITLELSNHGNRPIRVLVGQPIAQVVFHLLDYPTEIPYRGKYHNQGAEPVEAKFVHHEEDTST